MAHGLADLMAAGRMHAIQHLAPADRDRAFSGIMARAIPG
jgi:hypothetical protein